MTVADVRAVSPRAFTRWKDTLMTRLYEAAREEAQRGPVARRPLDDEGVVQELAPRLSVGGEEKLREHLALCPRPYLVEVDPEEILVHLSLLADLEREALAFRAVEEDGFDRLYVATRDRPRLFSALCGALAACGLNIVAAQAFTRKDAIALDRVAVVPAPSEEAVLHPSPARWEEVHETIARVLSGEVDPDALIAARARRVTSAEPASPGRRRPPVRVRVSNKISAQTTVVDVTAPDRPGLLHDLAAALSDAGLDMRLAKIATKGDRAVDVFYVTSTSGEKVTTAAGLARIRRLVAAAARGER
jgi:[protein-PII] uridylyltransferase